MTSQSAILPLTERHSLFLTLSVSDSAQALQQCASLEEIAQGLIGETGTETCYTSVAFSAEFWQRIAPQSHPTKLKHFPELGDDFDAPATAGDVLVHAHSDRQDVLLELARRFLAPMGGTANIEDETYGFRYLDARDLTGFIDGTENPQGEQRAVVALVEEDPNYHGGSYVLAQRYVHNLNRWQTLSDSEQEQVIGRTKPDSIELSGDDMPPTSHVSRVDIGSKENPMKILRHSAPYGTLSGDNGLYFLAYAKDATIFDEMLGRMFGVAEDGLHDHLLHYSQPVTSGYYFAPSVEMLTELAASAN